MTRFGTHAAHFEFRSDRFDASSELPADANAGNRFYGRDVAEFISAGLSARGLDASFFDEDWGWQVHARRSDGSVLEISVYHSQDTHADATGEGWELMIRLLRKQRTLGFVPRFGEVELDADAEAAVTGVFADAGITLHRA